MKKLFSIFAVVVLGLMFSCHSEQVEGNPLTMDYGGAGGSSGLSSGYYGSSSSFLRSSSSDFWQQQPQSSSGASMCNNAQYNQMEQGCCVYTVFSLAEQRCQGNIVETRCGSNWYDAIIQRCENYVVETMCGNGWYNATSAYLRCQSNIVETRCGSGWYNAANINLRCNGNVIETFCGAEWYDAASAAVECQNQCGVNRYDPMYQRCGSNNVVETLCGSGWYDAYSANLRCWDNVVETLCGYEWYNADNGNLRCWSNVVETRCGSGWYPYNFMEESCPVSSSSSLSSSSSSASVLTCAALPQTTGAEGEAIASPAVKCGDNNVDFNSIAWFSNPNWSNPIAGTYSNVMAIASCNDSTQTANCYGTLTVSSACTDNSYGAGQPLTYGGQTYSTVKIGCQTWMAENLNYNAEGSICYHNQDSYCNTYGRLYNWVTTMALPASCETTFCASQINAKYRGICPSSWHIPNSSDWHILMNYVQTDNGSTYTPLLGAKAFLAGKYLKATSGWSTYSGIINDDKYGFAALPGGYVYIDGSFRNAGNYGSWWSASELNKSLVHNLGMHHYDDDASLGFFDKDALLSVRCVKD